MRDNWLILAIDLIAICFLDNYLYRGIFCFVSALVFLKLFNNRNKIIMLVVMVALMICSYPMNNTYFNQAKVKDIRNGYIIVSDGLRKAIVYTGQDIRLDSIIEINGEAQPVNYYNNFETTDYSLYCKGNNIVGSFSLKEIKVIKEGKSVRNYIYNNNLLRGNNWLNQLLFSSSLDVLSDNKYLISQCGFHVSFLASLLQKQLQKHYYQKKSKQLTIVIIGLLGLLFHIPFAYIKVLISLVLTYFIKDKRQSLGYEIIILCLLKPYYVKSVSFLLPVLIKLFSLFSDKRHFLASQGAVIAVNMRFYGYYDLLSALLFPLSRSLFGTLYTISILLCFLPLKLPFNDVLIRIIELTDGIGKLYIKGRFSILITIVFVGLVLRYLYSNKKIYPLILTALVVINSNYRLLVPFYTVTFLDVGQGDCCVVTSPFSKTALMIDTGGNYYKDVASDIDIPYLLRSGISAINVLISHDDNDHSGALQKLTLKYKVLNVYRNKEELRKLGRLQVNTLLSDREYTDINDNSQITYLHIGNFGFLFLGDVSGEVEKELVERYGNLDVSVVKLSHHGSKTATTEQLISQYQFPLAIISAGRRNTYHHPSGEVLQRLKDYQVDWLTTQDSHGIKFIVFRHLLFYVTSANQVGIYTKW